MANTWFDIASLDHFWVERRFAVLLRLCGHQVSSAREMAEIGCGHGLLQRQIEDQYGKPVTGFDLNQYGLQHSLSRISRLCSYDIQQRNQEFRGKFDLIFLFDVLEHIHDEDRFLDSLLFHLAPKGKLILNVPAGQWAFSNYDVAAGHVRRYGIDALQAVALRNKLQLEEWTFWGLPLVPALVARKLVLMGAGDERKIIATGFDSKASWINNALKTLSQLEWIPQKILGTSLMAVLHGTNGIT